MLTIAKKLWSAFTDDMDHCMFTGSNRIERHHIFGGSRKRASEEYGYMAPLRADLHPNGVFAGPRAHEIDIKLKQMAQRDFEEKHGTRKEFVQIFVKSYL